MNYNKIIFYDTGNAKGLSTVLFVQGCTNNCRHCHNPETHNFKGGKPFTNKEIQMILSSFNNNHVKNLVISGGDPCHQNNLIDITELAIRVKNFYPNINIIVYTGYTLEELQNRNSETFKSLEKNIDYLIDGKYIEEQAVKGIDYRGSYNQRCFHFICGSPIIDENYFLLKE